MVHPMKIPPGHHPIAVVCNARGEELTRASEERGERAGDGGGDDFDDDVGGGARGAPDDGVGLVAGGGGEGEGARVEGAGWGRGGSAGGWVRLRIEGRASRILTCRLQ